VKAFVPESAREPSTVLAKSREKKILPASVKESEWAILVPRR
jgi:hypothetical protein